MVVKEPKLIPGEARCLISDYLSLFRAIAEKPKQNRDAETYKERVNHLFWMCMQLDDITDNPGKFFRWLGFIQGALWQFNLRSIDEMRVDNYKIINGKSPP